MAIKTIPLSSLPAELQTTLNECADSGQTVVIELPDHRLVALQPLDLGEDDSLVDELLNSDAAFRAVVAKSKEGTRKPFPADCGR